MFVPCPQFATSVMISGWYQDDSDEGKKLWYTGKLAREVGKKYLSFLDANWHPPK